MLLAYINQLASTQTVQLYIDVHSYSQLFMTRTVPSPSLSGPHNAELILLPAYGYSCTAVAPNSATLNTLARGVAAAIRAVYGTVYQSGPVCSTIYQVSGGSVDYVADVTKAKYTFTIELRDTGTNGFVLPASQILPTGVETWAGFRYLLLNMV